MDEPAQTSQIRPRRQWVVVGSPDNVARTIDLGFTVQGFKSRQRKKVERMAPGDRLAYYVTGQKVFAATAVVTSVGFEDHDPIWRSVDPKRADEDYPWRVHIAPDLLAIWEDWVPAEPIARQMAYVQKWPTKHWTLAFQGNLHEVDAADFALIRDALAAAMVAEGAAVTAG